MQERLKIKVCGMRNPENIRQLMKLEVDYIGMIFYPKSKRYIGSIAKDELIKSISADTQKIGVFVNERIQDVVEKYGAYNLDLVQIHGDETADYCRKLAELNIPVLKAFGIDENFDFKSLNEYASSCKYFLFDTKTEDYGGSGRRFNWDMLKGYDNELPLFLSGGIGPDDASEIKKLSWLNIHSVDINSRFEIEPGLKNIKLISDFITELKNE